MNPTLSGLKSWPSLRVLCGRNPHSNFDLTADNHQRSGWRMLKLLQQRCCQRSNVLKPICPCPEQHHGERESCQILLIRNLPINGYEEIAKCPHGAR